MVSQDTYSHISQLIYFGNKGEFYIGGKNYLGGLIIQDRGKLELLYFDTFLDPAFVRRSLILVLQSNSSLVGLHFF